ncbi:hypothetical protein ACIRSU_03955 [Streptomyces sp. NPDC101160]|uniref:hypothetical protein n=1 Tax=Streptomyces sp. NPDC101160 TaxID=3366118 RepID=UPI00380A45B6
MWPSPAPAWSARRGGDQAAPLHLHTTTRHLQLWEGTTLVWAHGWDAVRWETDGSVLRVLHGDVELARLEGPGGATRNCRGTSAAWRTGSPPASDGARVRRSDPAV